MYLITTEDDDGMWLDDPIGYNSVAEAKEAERKMPPPLKGYGRVLYHCSMIELIRETPSGVDD
jgi:hypothetical protein